MVDLRSPAISKIGRLAPPSGSKTHLFGAIDPTASDGRHIAGQESALVSGEPGESVMREVSSALHYVSLIGTVVFSFTLTTTWAALLGYGLFRLGEWALAG
jgi:hypothetical protein